jgi:putative oxidoreductase
MLQITRVSSHAQTDIHAHWRIRDAAILVARILLAVLFLVFGWDNFTEQVGTVGYTTRAGAFLPLFALVESMLEVFDALGALVAIVVEVFAALAVALGLWTRPLALLLALYTLGTALIGHPFWMMEGADRYANAINFYKNISIIGGFLLLYVTGAGRYSVDAWRFKGA